MAYIGTSPQNGVRNRFVYAATQGQTAFTGADSDGKTLAISDQLYTDVYQNGVKLKLTTDWTASSTTVTLVNAASVSDVIEILSFDVFSVSDTVPASTGGAFAGGISATSYGAVSGTTGVFSGNVGIGTTDPGTSKLYLQDNHTTDVTNAATMIANTVFSINGNASEGSDVLRVGPMSSAGAYFMEVSNSAGNAAYNLCLNPINGGNVLMGLTASTDIAGTTNNGWMLKNGVVQHTAPSTMMYMTNSLSGTQTFISFYSQSSGVGTIQTNGSSTSFNTSSDYRLKENVDYTWDATTRLKQLKPARFNFIVDETNTLVDGFLAHEVSSIVPEAITGTKDEVDDNGDAVMQGIDQSKLVPLLIKTIQELEARITALEA